MLGRQSVRRDGAAHLPETRESRSHVRLRTVGWFGQTSSDRWSLQIDAGGARFAGHQPRILDLPISTVPVNDDAIDRRRASSTPPPSRLSGVRNWFPHVIVIEVHFDCCRPVGGLWIT